jgi:hypothetical protein
MVEASAASRQDNPEVRHEASDIKAKFILLSALALALAAVVIHIGLYWLLAAYDARVPPQAAPLSAPADEIKAPELPRLQISPPTDLQKMRAAEAETLHGYGWVDKDKKIVRIPIDRAMELMAQKGLPARNEPPANKGTATETQTRKAGR